MLVILQVLFPRQERFLQSFSNTKAVPITDVKFCLTLQLS